MINTSGVIENSQTPLAFVSPKEDALFFYSSLYKKTQAIPCEVIGGSEDLLEIYYDDKPYLLAERPFIFSLPVEKGLHSCRIICGNEAREIEFTVK